MDRWTRFVIRHRWAVLAAWLVVFVVSGMAASGLSELLTNRFSLPGTDTARAEKILEEEFGQKSTGSFSVVVRGEAPGSAEALVAQVQAAAERASKELPTSKVVAVQPVSDRVVTATIASKLEPADAKSYTDEMRAAAGQIEGAELLISGQAAIEHDLDPVFNEDLKVGELYIAIPIAALILVFVFGTLALLVPFMFAAATISASLGIIWIVAQWMELTTYLQNLVMLIGLGIAIDYSLLVVYRYREELSRGGSKEDAVVRTMATAGRAVVFSGIAVGIGLALMLFMPLPFIRGFGVGGLVIPLVSVIAAVTLLPVLIYFLAAKLDRVGLLPRGVTARRDSEENMWYRLARSIMRRPVAYATGTAALLVALTLPLLALELGPGSNKGIPQDLEGVRGLNVISDAVGEGALAPTTLAIDTGRADGALSADVEAAVERLIVRLERDPEIVRVDYDAGPQHVDASGRYLRIDAVGRSEYGAPQALAFVDRLRDEIVPTAGFPRGVDVYAGGGPPSGVDFLDMAYGAFPWLVAGVLLLTYVLLLRAFRSVVLPLKAIVLNLLSIGAAYGILTAFFKWGPAEAVGLIGFDQIEGWIPIFIFAMVFGLSMDYEVFLVSRMREEWDRTRDNEYAVSLGLAKTGRIVTAAGLIMFAAFMGFVAGSIVGLQQFGFGLAVAILLDVTIVRALLVPSAMKLFGRWNWWLPEGVARVVRVKPSPLEPARQPAMSPSGR
ncbi:MAG: MMPL family transporter [Actinomycetota bacterium]|nr:MMPL family transporter [Actinomycetota bacterium]